MSSLHAPPRLASSIRTSLSPLRYGPGDPTTSLGALELWRATHTPDGPGTLRVNWSQLSTSGTADRVQVATWGPGGGWLSGQVPAMLGELDGGFTFTHAHPSILRAQRRHPGLRLGASGDLYHELLPVILAQRITAGEACRQWRQLCIELGEPAPGPHPHLRLPPHPERLAGMPSWWFHPRGVERTRAEALITVARHAHRLWDWCISGSVGAAGNLVRLRGVGEWTIGVVLATALGEPDAVAVGDYHVKNTVGWALAGEPRATDERMLELLEPHRGQRGRVVRLLSLDGARAPKFGPRARVLPMAQW